jgi:2,5-diamino-6-(ribosylamino)-4(3H)-pyrimidinone 5'-phosphate reductase
MNPKVIVYAATSVDSRTTGFPVDMGLFYSLAAQWGEKASLVGCDTLLRAPVEIPPDDGADMPESASNTEDPRPVLVVPDSRGRLRSWHFWRAQPFWKDWIALCTRATPPAHIAYLNRKGIRSLMAGDQHVDFAEAFRELATRFGIDTIRVDSGGTLNGVLLRAGLVDEVHLLVHPVLVGDAERPTFFQDPIVNRAEGIALQFLRSEVHGEGNLLISYKVVGT